MRNCRVCGIELIDGENWYPHDIKNGNYICIKHAKEYKRNSRLKKRGNFPEKITPHHIKYKEIHGVDEVKKMTESEHRMLHFDLRKDGKCNISAEELKIISHRAIGRIPKYREMCKEYNKLIKRKTFSDTIETNIYLKTCIEYNGHNDTFTVNSSFTGTKNTKLKYIRKKYDGYKFI